MISIEYLGYILFLLLVVVSLAIFFAGKAIRKFMIPRWFQIKTFVARFIFAPLIFMWVLSINLENEEARASLWIILLLAGLDRLAAWFDRNVPDSNPNKYR